MRAKFYGQADLVLTGQHHCNSGTSFTLTSGVFADQPWPGVTGGGVISGALHGFVSSAAISFPAGCASTSSAPPRSKIGRRLRRPIPWHAPSVDGPTHRALHALHSRQRHRQRHPRVRVMTTRNAENQRISYPPLGQAIVRSRRALLRCSPTGREEPCRRSRRPHPCSGSGSRCVRSAELFAPQRDDHFGCHVGNVDGLRLVQARQELRNDASW